MLAVLGSTITAAALLAGLAPTAAVAADDTPPARVATTSPAPADSRAPSRASDTTPTSPTIAPPSTPDSTPPSTSTPESTKPADPTPRSSTPSTAPKAAAALSISLDQPARNWEDRPLTFTGKLSNGAANYYVSLWQLRGSSWILRAAAYSKAGGVYKLTYTSPGPVYSYFRTAIGSKYTAAQALSPMRIATAMDRRILIDKPAPAYTALTGVVVSGRLSPGEAGRQLVLQDRGGANGAWRNLRYGNANVNGYFRLPVPDNVPATRTVRVVSRGVPAAAVEVSPTATIVVKAYLNPVVYTVSAAMVPKTYRSGCPVGPRSLRLLKLNYWGFDGVLHRGELIVRDAAVQKMITVWNASLVAKFRVRRMQRVDVYGGSDIRSMEADNTSVFNCRQVTGNPYALSPHSYGFAIDINTVENPYLAANGVWYPSNSGSYRNRSVARMGMLFDSSTPTRALAGQGYFWGKNWSKPDYQHFQPR